MKKIINNKTIIPLVVLLIAFVSSCTKDFEKLNTNPNKPTADKASPSMLLTNVIESMSNRIHETFLGTEMGNCWAQHFAKVQYTDEDRYIPRGGVINATFNSFYGASGMDINTIYKYADANKLNNYKGVAIVLKVYVVSVLTDLFGDVPYTEAWKGSSVDGGILAPKYDTQEFIYRDIVKKLDTANVLLDKAGAAIEGDIMYDNDIVKWKKFANSLRMRLLMRMSAKDPAYVGAELSKMVADPVKYPIFESNADNAQLNYLGSAPNNNPMNENKKTRDDHHVSQTIVDMMWTDNPNVDYRIAVYANKPKDGGDWVGMPNGLTSAKAADYKGNGITKTSQIGDYFTKATAPGMFMSYAELQFILAEGVQRKLIAGAAKTAKDYYEKGIYGSYKQFEPDIVERSIAHDLIPKAKVTKWTADSLALDYINKGGAAWNEAKALERIAIERWLATYDQGLQSWFEWRRTGFPVLTPAIDGANGGKIPVRVTYPSDEMSSNPTNVKAAIARQGPDDLNTKVWWNK